MEAVELSPTDPRLTRKQKAALALRCRRGATVKQMARWLGISMRAVRYRMQNARERCGGEMDAPPTRTVRKRHKRIFVVSQISTGRGAGTLDMDGV